MPAPSRLTELAQRKELLLMQSDLHRQLIAVERHHLQARFQSATDSVKTNRWWLVGGALGAGWLMRRSAGKLTRWLPLAATAWSFMKKMRAS
jgi:hypothetical protein